MKARTQNPDLVALKRVDGLDQRLVRLERERADLPEELRRYQREVDKAQATIEALQARQKELQKEIDARELDVGSNTEQIGRYRGQQNTAKTNEEYGTLKRQIVALEEKNAAIEDEALERYVGIDELKEQEREARRDLEDAKRVLGREQADIEAELAEVEKKIAAIEAERAEVLTALTPEILSLYERIRSKQRGRALAPLHGAKCSGCHLDVPSGRVGAVHNGQDVVMCPQCSRILYLD